MRNIIADKLREIEREKNVRVLLAVESGSRAWGFASTDSDYDVRFIYVRSQRDYLRLETLRDVIELPINDDLDVVGWDLSKTLKLLAKSNPSCFEWLASPIVYAEDADFCRTFRPLAQRYFSVKRGAVHYANMARKNYREYLLDDEVKLKKYFYVLRPVLAARWVLDKKSPPPMLFDELAEAELDARLRPDVLRLLDLKRNAPEVKKIPRIAAINQYLESEIERVLEHISRLPNETNPGWAPLDEAFFAEISKSA